MIYKTKGICAFEINYDVEDGKVKNVVFNLENVYKMDDSGYKNLIKCYNISSKNNGNSMICLNKNKFNYDLKSLNIVKDELSACHLINS